MRGRTLAFGLLAAAAAITPAIAQSRSGGTGAAHAADTGPNPSRAQAAPGAGRNADASQAPARDAGAGVGARDAAANTAAAIRADAGRDMVSRVSQLIGAPVRLQAGGDLGEIADVVLDAQGFAQYLVIAANNRYALVPFGMAEVDLPRRRVTVGVTADRLDLAAFDRDEWANLSMPMLNQRMGRVYGEAIYPGGGAGAGGAGNGLGGREAMRPPLGDPQRDNPISPRNGTLGADNAIAPGSPVSPNAAQARDGVRGDRNGGGDLPRSPGAVGDQIGGGRGLPGNIGPGTGGPGTGAGTGPGSGTGLGTGGTQPNASGGGTIGGGTQPNASGAGGAGAAGGSGVNPGTGGGAGGGPGSGAGLGGGSSAGSL
jgi:sporulation protein YlmC with PRC-barrel domain